MATEETRSVESGSIASQPPDAAFEEAARVVREEPGSDAHWDSLEGWAADRQQPDAVSRLYREILGRSLVAELAASLGQRAVAFHEEWFGEDSGALLEVLRRVIELDPSASEWAFSRLTVAYTSSERWEELLSLYDGEIARADDEARRVSLLDEAAQAAKDFAGAPDRAIGYLGELVRLRPDDVGQVRNLERLLERQERWADLVELLRARMARMDAAEARATRLAIAGLHLDKTRSYPEALVEIRALLDEPGADAAPAVGLLERIVADQEAPDASRRDAISLLRERYALEDRTTDVVRTLDTALEFADRGEQIALHAEAAERLAEQGQHAEAMDHYARMLRLSPADAGARARLRALADGSAAHARFVEILEQTADEAADGAARARLRVEAAEVRRAVLGDVEGAIALYNRALDEPDRGAELALVAARNLAALYASVGRRNARLVMLEAQAELEPEAAAREGVLREVAALATELGEADRALDAYRRLLEASPEDARALEQMIALLEAEGRWAALVEALRRRIAGAAVAWQTRADLVRIAHVESERRGDADAAIATWKEVAERFGEDADVVDALSELYTRTERFAELADLLARAAAREGEHLAAVRVRLGDTYRDRLGEPARAVAAYRQAIDASAADESARAGLATLSDEPSVRARAVEGLARSYAATDEWEPLLALLPQRLEAAEDDAARVELFREAAELEERRAGAETAALVSVGRAFALRPSDEKLEAELHRLGERTGSFAEVVEALAAAADRVVDDAHREAHLRATQARILEEELEREGDAFDAYRRAFRAQPRQEALGRAVVRLAGATDRWAEADEALAAAASSELASDGVLQLYAEVQRLSPGRALFDTLCRLGDRSPSDLDPLVEALAVAKAHLGDEALVTDTVRRLYERASALFQGGARATGEHAAQDVAVSALVELVERLEREGNPRAAMARLIEGARLPVDPAIATAWKRRAAAIAAGPVGDHAVAIDLYRDVLTSSPTDTEAPRALGDLLEAEGRLAELLGLRKIELARCDDPERRLALRLSIAELVAAIEALGGRVEALKENLAERPGHAPTVEALIGVLTAQHRFGELADVLTAQAEALDGPLAAPLWHKVAELAEGELADVERALGAYRRVVSLKATPGALDALARISTSRGDHAMASFWLERRLAMATDAEHTELSLALASALKAAGRRDRIPAVLEPAREKDPKNAEVRGMLADEYRATGAFEPLAALLGQSVEHVDDAAEVLTIVREAAELYEGALRRPEQAIPLMRRGIELAPDDLGMRMKLAEALRAVGRLDEARDALHELIEGFGRRRSAERAQVHHLLGRVARAQGDLEGALEQLDRAEKAYRTLLMIVRRRSPEDAVEVGLGEVLFELHAIAKAHGDADKAEELLASALEAASQSEPEALRFAEALASRGEPALAVKGVERRLAVAEAPPEKAKLLATLADVLAGPLGRPGEALERRLAALRMAPDDQALHDAARALAKSEGASSKYVDVVRELVDGYRRKEDAPKVSALLLLAGRALEEDLGDLDAAAQLFGRAEELTEGAPRTEARLALARLYAQKGDHDAQRRIYEALVADESVDAAERLELAYRLAAVELEAPETVEAGLATLKRAYEREPRHARVCAVLAAAVERGASPPALVAFYEQVARAAGDEALLLDFLAQKASLADASSVTLREAAERALSLGAGARAERFLEGLVELADRGGASEDELRFAVLALASERERAGDVASAIRWLERAVTTAGDADERRALRLRLAGLGTREGGDLRAAAEAYRGLLEEDGHERAVWEPLLDVYARLGDEAGLSDLVSTLIDALLDPAERNVARLARAGFLMNVEGRSPDAVDVLKAMLDEEPEHAEAGRLLATLYEKIGYDEDLVALLERQVDVARDAQDREKIVELSLKLGGLLGEVRRDDAMDVYRRALDWVPEERAVVLALLDLFGPDHDARERLEVRERLLATERGDEASRLSLELHRAWDELGDAEGAERVLGLGYAANPGDAEIRGRLEALYRERDDAERLAAFLARDAERVRDDAPAFRERIFEAARLYRDRLGRPTQAAEVLRVTMGSQLDVDVLAELVQCLETADQVDAAVDEVTSALEAHADADATRVALLRMRARLELGRGNVDVAVEDLEAAHATDPRSARAELVAALVRARGEAELGGDRARQREVSLRLVGVLEAAGDKAQARDVLASWVRAEPSDVESLVWLRDVDVASENWPGVIFACGHLIDAAHGEEQVRAAMLLADATEATGDVDAARDALERVHRAQPEQPAILARLKLVYERAGAHRDLAMLLLTEARTMEDDARFAAYRRAGELLITQVGDLDAALPALEAAYQLRPDDHESTILLVDAYTQLGQHADAGQLIESAIANHPKRRSPELSQLQHRMARLARFSGDRELDLQWMNAALECDKNNMEVAAELAELAMTLGDHETALNALRAITLARTEGPMSRAMAFLLQARIAHQRGEARRALLWARKAKSEDPELEAATEFLRELGES
jgi:tetratricopeptide (TPR) repeat protein